MIAVSVAVILYILRTPNATEGADTVEYYADENGSVSFVTGRFSDIKVTNMEEAKQVLEENANLLLCDDVENELQGYQQDENAGQTFYRFQQYYGEYPVYGGEIVLAVDEDAYPCAYSGSYVPQISTVEGIFTQKEAANKVEALFTEIFSVSTSGMVYYPNEGGTYILAYVFDGYGIIDEVTEFNRYYISSTDGSILAVNSLFCEVIENTVVEVAESDGNSKTELNFDAWKNDDGAYELKDTERNIEIYDMKGYGAKFELYRDDSYTERVYSMEEATVFKIIPSYSNKAESANYFDRPTGEPVKNTDAGWLRGARFKSYLDTTYDYYLKKGRDGVNGKHPLVVGLINDPMNFYDFEDSGNNEKTKWESHEEDNAYCVSTSDGWFCQISVGTKADLQLDVIAHEYTHGIENGIFGESNGGGEHAALQEALADIMGIVIENDENWQVGKYRNLMNPAKDENPEAYGSDDPYFVDPSSTKDAHTNCTIIGHIASRMFSSKKFSMNEIGDIWYHSMFYLTSTSKFADCRAAVIASAKNLGYSADKVTYIEQLFDDANIKTKYAYKVSGVIVDEDGELISNNYIQVDNDKTDIRYIPSGKYEILLEPGTHILTVYGGVGGITIEPYSENVEQNERLQTTYEPVNIRISVKTKEMELKDIVLSKRIKDMNQERTNIETENGNAESLGNSYIGTWMIDIEKTNNENADSNIQTAFGTGFKYGNHLTLNADGSMSWGVGISCGGEGNYKVLDDTIHATYTYTDSDNEQTLDLQVVHFIGTDDVYLHWDYDGFQVYWVKEKTEAEKNEIYQEVVDAYQQFISSGQYRTAIDTEERWLGGAVQECAGVQWGNSANGYAILDIDGDSTPELLLRSDYGLTDEWYYAAIFSFDANSQSVKLLAEMHPFGDIMYGAIMNSDQSGVILYYDQFAYTSGKTNFYTIQDGELALIYSVIFEADYYWGNGKYGRWWNEGSHGTTELRKTDYDAYFQGTETVDFQPITANG